MFQTLQGLRQLVRIRERTISHASQVIGNVKSTQGVGYQQCNTFPEQKISASPGPSLLLMNPILIRLGIGTLSGLQFLWGNPTPYSERTSPAWSTSVGHPFASSAQGQGYYPYFNHNGSFLGSPNPHHVGSAPSGVLLDRHFGYFPDSPETSFMNPVAFGGLGLSGKTASYVMNVGAHPAMSVGVALPGNMPESGSPRPRMMPLSRNGSMFFGNSTFQGTGLTGNEGLLECGRSRRVEYSVSQIDSKKQYQLHVDKINSGEDSRTTFMIKNIPNKYTSKRLLEAIDEFHRGICKNSRKGSPCYALPEF